MRKNGFTLIELLVVIAIIALLLGILLPSLARVKKLSRRVKCMTNLRSLGQTFHIYAAENDDKIVEICGYKDNPINFYFWAAVFDDHYGISNMILCPEANQNSDDSFDIAMGVGQKHGLPKEPWVRKPLGGQYAGIEYSGSYGTNGWVQSYMPKQYRASLPCKYRWGGKMSDCRPEVPLLLDSVTPDGTPLLYNPEDGGEPVTKAQMERWLDKGHDLPDWELRAIMLKSHVNIFCFDRHDYHINTVFIDGGVRSVKVDELWMLDWTKNFPKKRVTIEW